MIYRNNLTKKIAQTHNYKHMKTIEQNRDKHIHIHMIFEGKELLMRWMFCNECRFSIFEGSKLNCPQKFHNLLPYFCVQTSIYRIKTPSISIITQFHI